MVVLAAVASSAGGGRIIPDKPIITQTSKGVFSISNYNPSFQYIVSVNTGTATIDGSSISLSAENSICSVSAKAPKGVTESNQASIERKAYTFHNERVQTGTEQYQTGTEQYDTGQRTSRNVFSYIGGAYFYVTGPMSGSWQCPSNMTLTNGNQCWADVAVWDVVVYGTRATYGTRPTYGDIPVKDGLPSGYIDSNGEWIKIS